MNKKYTVFTSSLILLILFVTSNIYAARIKGNVAMLAADHEQACSAVSMLAGSDTENGKDCLLDPEVTTLLVVDTGKKAGISEGQDIILKARGIHKVMAKAYRLFPAGTTAAEISAAIEKNGVIALKDTNGCIILIMPEKPFEPEKDSSVTIKTKQKQMVEGC